MSVLCELRMKMVNTTCVNNRTPEPLLGSFRDYREAVLKALLDVALEAIARGGIQSGILATFE